jgi:hypothetical protein
MAYIFGFPWRGLFSRRNQQDRGRTVKARNRRNSLVPKMDVLEDRCVPSLIPSADGMTVYDTKTRMNWLANADLTATKSFGVKGINADGSMNYKTAVAWIASLNSADYLGHNNWRLPVGQVSRQGYYKKERFRSFTARLDDDEAVSRNITDHLTTVAGEQRP